MIVCEHRRDWELIDVLADAVENLTPAEPSLVNLVDQVRPLIVSGRRAEARKRLQVNDRTGYRDVGDALIAALSVDC
jgi:hypothetical protein